MLRKSAEPDWLREMAGGRPAVQRPSLGDEVYEIVLAELISLRIPPGERLSVDALARQFGVSQTPIRAALIRLEADGLVVKKHNSGYSAATMPSGRRFAEIYEIRLLLEPAVAGGAALRADRGALARLEALSEEMEALVKADAQANYGKFALLDGQFHTLLAELCGNAIIAETLERLFTHMHLFRLRYQSNVASEAVKEHMQIIAAIRQGAAASAEAAMRSHVCASRDRMMPFYRTLD